ncbi:winged helix-turn-helix transcriptional regulator [Promicromonospora sp. Populi]|uniref:winged helix-turn-helix transcriptional regulator n=1 Tax=Promicromonospora sp. Populi TaxID=3239420 RepID=UPI0034E2FF0B
MSITDLEPVDPGPDVPGSVVPGPDVPGSVASGSVASGSDLPGDDPTDGPPQDLVIDVFARDCPSRAAFEDVTAKWASLALLALGEGSYRFNALRRRVEGVSEKMLSQTLQTLERDGMVTRDVVTNIPPRVEYSLTPLGGRVAEKLRALADVLEGSVAETARGGSSSSVD